MMHFCGINERQLEDDYCCGIKTKQGASYCSKNHGSVQPNFRHRFEKEVQTSELAARHRQKQRLHLRKKVSLSKVGSKNKSCTRESSFAQSLKKNSNEAQKSLLTSTQTPAASYHKNSLNSHHQAYHAKTTLNRGNQTRHFDFIPLQRVQNQNLYGPQNDGSREKIEQILIDLKLLGQTPKYYQSNIVPTQNFNKAPIGPPQAQKHQISPQTNLTIQKNHPSPASSINASTTRKQSIQKIVTKKQSSYKVEQKIKNPLQVKKEKNIIPEVSNQNSQVTEEIKPYSNSYTPVTLSNASSKQEMHLPPPLFAFQKKKDTVMSMYDSEMYQSSKPSSSSSEVPTVQKPSNPQKMTESGKKIEESVIIMDFFHLQNKLKQLIEQNPKFWQQNSRLE